MSSLFVLKSRCHEKEDMAVGCKVRFQPQHLPFNRREDGWCWQWVQQWTCWNRSRKMEDNKKLNSLHPFQLIYSLTKADCFLGIDDTQIVKPKIPSEQCYFSCRKCQCSPGMSNLKSMKRDIWTINCNEPATKPFLKEANLQSKLLISGRVVWRSALFKVYITWWPALLMP